MNAAKVGTIGVRPRIVGDIPELGRFGEEGACHFDFAGLIGRVIDVILCSNGPRVNGSEGQVPAGEDGGLIELCVGHSGCRCRKDGIEIGICWAVRRRRFWALCRRRGCDERQCDGAGNGM